MNKWLEAITGPAFVRFVAFMMFVVAVVLAMLGWQVEQRNEQLDELRLSAARIEEAATHTEEVLLEVVEARESEEAVTRNAAVARALIEIGDIKRILCDTVEHAICQEDEP